jgi:CubicO group peptidase (beta-lactamase class C family)
MLKLGVCMLDHGRWQGRAIVSEDWVDKSSRPYPGNQGIHVPGEPSGRVGYSYSWWTKDYLEGAKRIHMYAASGWGGQHIMVLPELGMVVVFTGANYLTKRPPFKILEKYILPALK